jgi:hypothetical protein
MTRKSFLASIGALIAAPFVNWGKRPAPAARKSGFTIEGKWTREVRFREEGQDPFKSTRAPDPWRDVAMKFGGDWGMDDIFTDRSDA